MNSIRRQTAQELADFGADYIAGCSNTIFPYDVLISADGRLVQPIYSMGNLISHFSDDQHHAGAQFDKQARGAVEADNHYFACYTSLELDGAKYVTIPLVNRVFHSETNQRVQEHRRHIVRFLGKGIMPSHGFDTHQKKTKRKTRRDLLCCAIS